MRSTGRVGFTATRPGARPTAISLLALELPDYLQALGQGCAGARDLIEEAGLRCARCGSGRCARPHGWRHRKKITDLSTGAVVENLPILRVRFCTGRTVSLMPGELWRGRFTITSVLEAVVHVVGEGVDRACEWAWAAGTGEAIVSESSLRRWHRIVRERLIGSALSWLAPHIGLTGAPIHHEADQLETLLAKITGALLVLFRCVFERGLLDRASSSRQTRTAHRSAPRGVGRHAPAPPPDPPRTLLPRGAWWQRRPRGPPPGNRMEVTEDDRRQEQSPTTHTP